MTNREKWEKEILALSDDAFADLLQAGRLPNGIEAQVEFGLRWCEWCKKTRGPCPCGEDEECVVSDLDYLRGEAR